MAIGIVILSFVTLGIISIVEINTTDTEDEKEETVVEETVWDTIE